MESKNNEKDQTIPNSDSINAYSEGHFTPIDDSVEFVDKIIARVDKQRDDRLKQLISGAHSNTDKFILAAVKQTAGPYLDEISTETLIGVKNTCINLQSEIVMAARTTSTPIEYHQLESVTKKVDAELEKRSSYDVINARVIVAENDITKWSLKDKNNQGGGADKNVHIKKSKSFEDYFEDQDKIRTILPALIEKYKNAKPIELAALQDAFVFKGYLQKGFAALRNYAEFYRYFCDRFSCSWDIESVQRHLRSTHASRNYAQRVADAGVFLTEVEESLLHTRSDKLDTE